MDIHVTGNTFFECLDPNVSQLSAECDLPTPIETKVGKGRRFTYRALTVDQLASVADQIEFHVWLLSSGMDAYDRRAYRSTLASLRKDLAKLRSTEMEAGAA